MIVTTHAVTRSHMVTREGYYQPHFHVRAPKVTSSRVAVQVTGIGAVHPAPPSPANVAAVKLTGPRRADGIQHARVLRPLLKHEVKYTFG